MTNLPVPQRLRRIHDPITMKKKTVLGDDDKGARGSDSAV
jgi:hypothetical protein